MACRAHPSLSARERNDESSMIRLLNPSICSQSVGRRKSRSGLMPDSAERPVWSSVKRVTRSSMVRRLFEPIPSA